MRKHHPEEKAVGWEVFMTTNLYIQNSVYYPVVSNRGNLYDNTSAHCNCTIYRKSLLMLTTELDQPSSYPVKVYDVNADLIGEAENKAQYIALWNSSPVNQVRGTLYGGSLPFGFIIKKNDGPMPDYVFGNPVLDANSLVTEEGDFIITEDGQNIVSE